MSDTVFFGTKFRVGQSFVFTVEGFFNKREYSGPDWLDLLIMNMQTLVRDTRDNCLTNSITTMNYIR